jgi:2-C-methyl-D-erythritol 4-phosphate cytidylyltransferase
VRVDANECIVESLPRIALRNMQTPQGFRQRVLRKAFDIGLQDPCFAPTDDCGVVQTYMPEIPIKIVMGEETNIKITYPKDLKLIKE